MITTEQARNVIGLTVTTNDGEKIGKAGQVFLDDETNQPEWTTVATGMFGSKESFVPLAEATLQGDALTVPYAKDMVKNAPQVDVNAGHLSQEEEAELYRYYGLGYSEHSSDSGLPAAGVTSDTDGRPDLAGAPGIVGRDTSGPTTDQAMTRSEEQLHAGTEKVTTGKARLRKYVETEQQTINVPVTKEKVRLETEPITDANLGAATAGPDISEEEHEVTLTEERVVVAKETVPVERVKLTTEVEHGEETVTEEVRKERFETEGVETQPKR